MDEVRTAYEKALRKMSSPSSPAGYTHPHLGTVLHNMGIISLLGGGYEAAVEYFKRAVVIREVCLEEGHIDHAVSESGGHRNKPDFY